MSCSPVPEPQALHHGIATRTLCIGDVVRAYVKVYLRVNPSSSDFRQYAQDLKMRRDSHEAPITTSNADCKTFAFHEAPVSADFEARLLRATHIVMQTVVSQCQKILDNKSNDIELLDTDHSTLQLWGQNIPKLVHTDPDPDSELAMLVPPEQCEHDVTHYPVFLIAFPPLRLRAPHSHSHGMEKLHLFQKFTADALHSAVRNALKSSEATVTVTATQNAQSVTTATAAAGPGPGPGASGLCDLLSVNFDVSEQVHLQHALEQLVKSIMIPKTKERVPGIDKLYAELTVHMGTDCTLDSSDVECKIKKFASAIMIAGKSNTLDSKESGHSEFERSENSRTVNHCRRLCRIFGARHGPGDTKSNEADTVFREWNDLKYTRADHDQSKYPWDSMNDWFFKWLKLYRKQIIMPLVGWNVGCAVCFVTC
jgi:hypothetical protein